MDSACERVLKATKSCKISAGVVDVTGSEDENHIKGGILSDSTVSWVSCGPRLTAINCRDGSKRTEWTFGWALHDPMYKVVCVEELPIRSVGNPVLIVCCEGEGAGSSLCFYHSGSSRVLKAIYFNEKITSLAVVSKSNEGEENLCKLLKPWSGIVAVGTGSGKVYLLDIWWKGLEKCMDDFRHKLYDEQKPSKVTEVSMHDLMNHAELKSSSVRSGSATLALWLNEESLQRGRGLQNILGRTPREFLAVSALKFFPQIAMLAVGYNTSCFQLWNLSTLTLQYTSVLLEAMLPVYTFGLLEPSDDPRFVCYLWALHHSVDEDSIPFAGMYLLSFREKHVNRYTNQFCYEGFSSCNICYQLDIGYEIENVVSGRIISCQAIHRESSRSSQLSLQSDTEDEATEVASASLLMIVWEVWTPNQAGVMRRLTLFDLNQWYREYMPRTLDVEYSHFMAHFCLPDGQLLAAKVLPRSVRQFVTLQPVDEHFYPLGTSFECVCLEQLHVVTCSHVGLQEECLQAIQEGGPSALILPSRLYRLCTQAGIKILLADPTSPTSSVMNEQREYVLSVALENGMTQFLHDCVGGWADGSHAVANCTLPSLLQWAWGRVQRYKKWLDRLCVPLFDYSGTALDSNDFPIFYHLISLLHSLHNLYRLVLKKYRNCILQDGFEQQHIAITMVASFYDSVLWCVRNKVLPEMNAEDAHVKGYIPYFTDKIVNYTISRRAELHHLAKSLKHPAPPSGLFLIDAVIAQEADGAKLTDQWEREGGGTTVGKYPPPSVQSLLRTYLVRDIPVRIKHFIVSYFLRDIVHELSATSLNENSTQKLLEYPLVFGLTESQSKIVEAFWCLDHKNFEEGVSLLLDSCVNREDLCVYQHRTVVSLLAASGHHKLALQYVNVKWPALNDTQDVRMKMALLLVNDLIHEAFEFQRQHNQTLSAELLHQFFEGCVEMSKLDKVFKLPLSAAEEEAFMEFLEKSTHPQADDLRVLYLLSRSRYIEAIDMNEKLRSVPGTRRGAGSLPLGHSPLGLHGQGRNVFGTRDKWTGAPTKAVLTTRDLIISSVARSLPSVTRELADMCAKEKSFSWKQVARPAPLSVVVHTELTHERLPFYKMTNSQFMEAAVNKTRETWAPLLATPAALKRKMSKVEDTPFLRTPLLARLNSSVTSMAMSPLTEKGGGLHSRLKYCTPQTKRARMDLTPVKEKDTTLEETKMELTCPESSALLHTPLVTRSIKRQQSRDVTTPHSILKGRSAVNTPVRSEKSFGSPAVVRQIRFSLPSDSPTSNSSPRKMTTRLTFDDDKTNVEQTRPERSATAEALLKKISSSPTSSEDSYFSLRSKNGSSPTSKKSKDGEPSFNLPLGLEGNEDDVDDLDVDEQDVSTDEQELDSESNSTTPEKNNESANRCINIDENSSLQEIFEPADEIPSLKCPKEVKIVVECSGKTVPKTPPPLKSCNVLEESFEEANTSFESDEENNDSSPENDVAPVRLPIYKWTKDVNGQNSEALRLQVSKLDEEGREKCVATVTLSKEMPMFYSEAVEEEVKKDKSILTKVESYEKAVEETKEEELSNDKRLFEKESVCLPDSEGILSNQSVSAETETPGMDLKNDSLEDQETSESTVFLEKVTAHDQISINDVPLTQVLEDILKRGRITSSPKDKSKVSFLEAGDTKDERTQHSEGTAVVEKELSAEKTNTNDLELEKLHSNDVPFTSQKERTLIESCVQLVKADNETISVQDSNISPSNQATIQEEVEALNVHSVPLNESIASNNSNTVDPQQDLTFQNLPKDKQTKEMSSPKKSKNTSFGSNLDNELMEDPGADIELQMSEGDSMEVYNKNEEDVEVDEIEEEMVYETLTSKGFQEDYKYDEEEEEEDIYGDIEDVEEAGSPEQHYEEEYLDEDESYDDRCNDDKSSDVICLGSSSDEEPPNPAYKRKSNQRSSMPKLPNETLDYEEDFKESDEDEEEGEESHYSESSQESVDGGSTSKEDSSSNKSFTYTSDSEEERNQHGNRSWKTETRVTGSRESMNQSNASEEDTIESPLFEVIGQDSQSGDKPIADAGPDRGLETIHEESEDKTCSKSEAYTSNIVSNLDDDNSLEKTKESEGISIEPNVVIQDCKTDSVQNIVSESKKKPSVETGSILDLKKRRSKRYSSASDLSLSKSRTRRRSCSFHDFASMMIMETKSAKALSAENIPDQVTVQEPNLVQSSPECTAMKHQSEVLNTELASSTPVQQSKSDTSTAHEGISSQASSLYVEEGSVASSQLQEDEVFSFATAKLSEYNKIRGKVPAGRFSSSLQNITEEMSYNSDMSRRLSGNSLRRSLSSNDLEEQHHFKEVPRRSNSVTRWSEYAKAHESEMASDLIDEETSIEHIDVPVNVTGRSNRKKKSRSISSLKSEEDKAAESHEMQTDDGKGDEAYVQNKQIDLIESVEHKESAVVSETTSSQHLESSDFKTQIDHSKKRAHSEPPLYPLVESPDPTKKRRSSSTLKIHNIHKKVLARHSLKGRYSQQISFDPLEVIVQSDEDSVTEKNQPSLEIQSPGGSGLKKKGRPKKTTQKTADDAREDSSRKGDLNENNKSVEKDISNITDNNDDQSSSKNCQGFETPKKELKNISLEHHSRVTESPSRKSRRNTSQISETEFVTQTEEAGSSKETSPNAECSQLEAHKLKEEERKEKKERSQSEPPTSPTRDMPNLTRKRRSSSLLKIQNVHKKVFARSSLRARHSQKISYEPLEVIVQSDEDSLRGNDIEKNISSEINQSPGEISPKKRGKRKKIKEYNFSKRRKTTENDNKESTSNENSKKDDESSEKEIPNVHHINDELRSQASSQVLETPKNEPKRASSGQHSRLIDSPARRTRQSSMQISETDEQEPPTKETNLAEVASQNLELSEVEAPKLNQRARSEPPISPTKEFPNLTSKRKSFSLLKIQNLHKKVFLRNSLRGRYSQKISYEPLEIIQSDEDSLNKSIDLNLGSETDQSPQEISKKKRGRPKKIKTAIDDASEGSSKKSNTKNKNNEISEEEIPGSSKHLHSQTPVKKSQITETPKKTRKNVALEQSNLIIDSPAKRTRRSMSRLSDTDVLTPTRDTSFTEVSTRRRTRLSSAMSDFGSPSRNPYAESEVSDVSTSSKVHTPSRRSLRNQSISAISTPGTPDILPEDYLLQRRLTRNQHAQLQKSFETSLLESPRISRLEDVPEEESGAESKASSSDISLSSKPSKSSARNTNKTTKQSKRKTTKK